MNFPQNGFGAPQGFNPNPFSPQGQAPAPNPFGAPQGAPLGGFPAPGGFGAPQGGPPAAVQASQLAGAFAGMGSAQASGDRLPPLPTGGHEIVVFSSARAERSQSPGEQHVVWFRVDMTVEQSKTAAPGTRACFQARLTGHQYPSQRSDDMARIRQLVASAYGKDPNSSQVCAEFDAQADAIMAGVLGGSIEGKKGTIINCEHKATKPKANRPAGVIGKYTIGPLGAAVQAPGPVTTPAAATPAQGPVWPPAGWTANPQQPGFYLGTFQGQPCNVSENDLRVAQASGKI